MAESIPAPIEETPKTEVIENPDTTTTDPDIKAVVVNVPEEALPAPEPVVKETPAPVEDESSAVTQPMAEPTTRTPVGGIVHFVMDDSKNRGACRPAIVVDVHADSAGEERVNLQVLTDGQNDYIFLHNGLRHREDIRHDEAKSPGSWHWLHGA